MLEFRSIFYDFSSNPRKFSSENYSQFFHHISRLSRFNPSQQQHRKFPRISFRIVFSLPINGTKFSGIWDASKCALSLTAVHHKNRKIMVPSSNRAPASRSINNNLHIRWWSGNDFGDFEETKKKKGGEKVSQAECKTLRLCESEVRFHFWNCFCLEIISRIPEKRLLIT